MAVLVFAKCSSIKWRPVTGSLLPAFAFCPDQHGKSDSMEKVEDGVADGLTVSMACSVGLCCACCSWIVLIIGCAGSYHLLEKALQALCVLKIFIAWAPVPSNQADTTLCTDLWAV